MYGSNNHSIVWQNKRNCQVPYVIALCICDELHKQYLAKKLIYPALIMCLL